MGIGTRSPTRTTPRHGLDPGGLKFRVTSMPIWQRQEWICQKTSSTSGPRQLAMHSPLCCSKNALRRKNRKWNCNVLRLADPSTQEGLALGRCLDHAGGHSILTEKIDLPFKHFTQLHAVTQLDRWPDSFER